MITEARDRGRGTQFKLLAYVCGSSCVVYPDNIGTVTYTRIFLQRPNNCRYAIVGLYSIADHDDEVLVFDLYETMQRGDTELVAPTPVKTCNDLDGAIMATAMLYRED